MKRHENQICHDGAKGKPYFQGVFKGRFIDRPNRFVVRCLVDGKICEAYLPNPGRLWELLFPGSILYLVKQSDTKSKMSYMAVAVERGGFPVLLHTHMTNQVVADLLESRRIPGLEEALVVRREATVGHSRFDFLLQWNDRPFLLEVKSCTLFGEKIAMFPDAVTVRGRRHLTELANLARQGTPGGVLFLVHSPHVQAFLPDYHTDIDFSRTFLDVKDILMVKAVSVTWQDDLTLGSAVRDVPIPWDIIDREAQDRGSYLFLLHMPEDRAITVGKLGRIIFRGGYYLYVGSAKTNLAKRMERHLRKRKNFFWHIDYLRHYALSCTALPVRASNPLEHDLASAIAAVADWSVPQFGSSDCNCPTHLFGMSENPIHNPRFIEVLLRFRIDRLNPLMA